MPMAITVSYRYERPRRTLTPFIGGGMNWHRYTETSDFADDGEDVSVHLHRASRARRRRVAPVALPGRRRRRPLDLACPTPWATEPTSVAAAFDEHDLGGFDLRSASWSAA